MTKADENEAVPPEETPAGGPEPTGDEPIEDTEDAAALRTQLDERTNDLKRVTAEYANYRKRVDRDRKLVADQATISVVTGLLPILDDLDRARDHGDLTGPFGSVAEQLVNALAKLGLTAFGEKGDGFDPNRHEAVAHMLSADVTEPTCIDVMRRGYQLGDRLVRAALVAVADPAEEPAPAATETAGSAEPAAEAPTEPAAEEPAAEKPAAEEPAEDGRGTDAGEPEAAADGDAETAADGDEPRDAASGDEPRDAEPGSSGDGGGRDDDTAKDAGDTAT